MADVTIKGQVLFPDRKTPQRGTAKLSATCGTVLDATSNTVFAGASSVKLDDQGAFSFAVPDPNDPNLNPVGFTYRLQVRLNSGGSLDVTFAVPAGVTELDLADLAPVPAFAGVPTTKGDKGDAGPATTLSIGTVTTGAPGSAASAVLSGQAPAQTLDLVIPQGQPGTPAPVQPAPIAYDTDGVPYLTI